MGIFTSFLGKRRLENNHDQDSTIDFKMGVIRKTLAEFSLKHLCVINIFEEVTMLISRKWLDSQMLCRFLKAQDMLKPFGV